MANSNLASMGNDSDSEACPGFVDEPGLHQECGCFELATAFELRNGGQRSPNRLDLDPRSFTATTSRPRLGAP